MLLQTERLNIRQVSNLYNYNIHKLLSLPETDEFNTLGLPKIIQITIQIVNEWLVEQISIPQTSYVFSIDLISTNHFIGLIALNIGKANYKSAEVWYKIHVDHWKKGYATEALTKLLAFSFKDLKLHRIEAGCAVGNIGSIRVLEKVGMTKEGMKIKKLPIRGEWIDNFFYAILEEDFLNKK